MRLSILLVCYNQEQYIKKCIDSILLQYIPFDYEIIVADDCSDDSTLSIIKRELLDKKINFKILSSSVNLGISKNYQRGFSECKGNYVAVIEGDDYWTSPSRIQKHLVFLDEHRECVMSMNRYVEFNVKFNLFSHTEWASDKEYKYITTQDMAKGNRLGNLSACVFRKTEIENIKPDLYNLEVADWILGLVLSQNGYIAILKEIMSVYRVHNLGEWSKMSALKKKESLIANIDSYNQYLEYKYDKEFSSYKLRLNSGDESKKTYQWSDFVPPIIKYILKLFIPKIIVDSIKK